MPFPTLLLSSHLTRRFHLSESLPCRIQGDVVFIQSGDRMPADVRLLRVTKLQLHEAMLTGESMPSKKSADAVAEDAPLGDRKCMGYSSTMVLSGQVRSLSQHARRQQRHHSSADRIIATDRLPPTNRCCCYCYTLS